MKNIGFCLLTDRNRIKQINGEAFAALNKLEKVWIDENVCIHKNFLTATAIATLSKEVNENCGFLEQSLPEELANLKTQISLLENEIANLRTKLAEAETFKQQSDETIRHLSMESSRLASGGLSTKGSSSFAVVLLLFMLFSM